MGDHVGLLEMFTIWVCLVLLLLCVMKNASELRTIREALTAGPVVEQEVE